MEYDKQNKKRIVIDYHNEEINNYLFDTNKFSLTDFVEQNKGQNKQECSKHVLEKQYGGFKYFGNKNKCFLFQSDQFGKKIDQDFLNQYNIQQYKKNKYEKDFLNYEDQQNHMNYFTPKNHYDFELQKKIGSYDSISLSNCLKKCIDKKKCTSVQYYEQPKECYFYKTKVRSNSKKNNNNNEEKESSYDIYTTKKNNDEKEIFHKNFSDANEKNDREYVYETSKITSCLDIPAYDNVAQMEKNYDTLCASTFGEEYHFSKNHNGKNVIKCPNGQKKLKCNFALNAGIETFDNQGTSLKNGKNQLNQMMNYYVVLLLLIIFLILGIRCF